MVGGGGREKFHESISSMWSDALKFNLGGKNALTDGSSVVYSSTLSVFFITNFFYA